MKENRHQDTGKSGTHAFTLIELLAIVAVCALLALLAFTAMARSRPQDHLVACANNLRQVGAAIHMYSQDNNGSLFLPPRVVHMVYDFNNPYAPANPLSAMRPYFLPSGSTNKIPFYACPGARPHQNLLFAPTPWSDANLVLNQLIWEKGTAWVRRPAHTIMVQEFLFRQCVVYFGPEKAAENQWSYWHNWTELNGREFGPRQEFYSSTHDQGGNLIFTDGHVAYKRHFDLSSLDFGLVTGNGSSDPYRPTSEQSRIFYSAAW